jgi:hypothetical protein
MDSSVLPSPALCASEQPAAVAGASRALDTTPWSAETLKLFAALTPLERSFAEWCAAGCTTADAYRRAKGKRTGETEHSRQYGFAIRSRPRVSAAIEAAQQDRQQLLSEAITAPPCPPAPANERVPEPLMSEEAELVERASNTLPTDRVDDTFADHGQEPSVATSPTASRSGYHLTSGTDSGRWVEKCGRFVRVQ